MSSLAAAEKLFAEAVDRHLAGDLSGAERRYRRLLARFPANVPSLLNLGIVLLARGAAEQALATFRRAVKAMPDNADAHNNLGTALERLGRFDEADAAYERALQLNPRHPDANNNVGNRLRARGCYLDAIERYRAVLAAEPMHLKALDNLGNALQADGRLDGARGAYHRAEQLHPTFGRRLKRALMLPPIYGSSAELEESRRRFFAGLAALEASPERIADPLEELNHLPFYLAYQGHDDRAALERFAGLLRPSLPEVVEPKTRREARRGRRIGFASAYWAAHSVSHCYLGHLPVLRAAGNEIVAIDLGTTGQGVPLDRHIAEHRPLPRDLAFARQAIADLRLDALIYFELGMDPMSYFLASSRLAPVQMVLSGHPITSGLRTVDCYISDRHTEADDADRAFTERLVRLDWFPSVWPTPGLAPNCRDRAPFGLPPSGALYVCPMMLFKLHPDFDRYLAGILEGDREGHLVLFEDRHSPRLGETLRRRFADTLGPLAPRVRFLPHLDLPDFLAVLRLATVMLDSRPFGGGTTLLHALALGVPYVTHPTGLTRGRVGAAFYRAIGVEGPIAGSAEDYVRRVLHLASEGKARAELSAEIAGKAHVLFDNPAGARGLAAVVEQAIASRTGRGV